MFIDHRMTPAQRAFSGNRCSDHLTVLNAFHRWQSLIYRNVDTTEFCERKMLSQPSLTTTADVTVPTFIISSYLIYLKQYICMLIIFKLHSTARNK